MMIDNVKKKKSSRINDKNSESDKRYDYQL